VLGYLMRKNEMTFKEALEHVQSCRPCVQPNDSFVAQLEAFDKQLAEARGEVDASSSGSSSSRSSSREKDGVQVGCSNTSTKAGMVASAATTTSIGPSIGPSMPMSVATGPQEAQQEASGGTKEDEKEEDVGVKGEDAASACVVSVGSAKAEVEVGEEKPSAKKLRSV